MGEIQAISVTRLARRIRNLLEIEIGDIWVEGEVSNLRKQASGHWYFSLKDESAQISCAMFSARRRSGNEVIQDGAKVQLLGETSFYEARGSTQLIVKKAQRVGKGDLQARFEALKKSLNEEGLFAQECKKPLPSFPRVIALITSPTGAVLQDMLNVLIRRAPWLQLVLYPVAVQGKGAERGIAQAIRQAGEGEDELPRAELIIIARGGGSMEDLWNFNEEVVARAIAACPIPVVSAVGHEIDFTIADFVADLRAPTPSAAAELVVPDRAELLARLSQLGERLKRVVCGRIDRLSDQLDYYERGIFSQSAEQKLQAPILRVENLRRDLTRATREAMNEREHFLAESQLKLARYHPHQIFKRRQERVTRLTKDLCHLARQDLEQRQSRLDGLGSLLQALGPGSVLERGFSITFGPDGEIIKSASELSPGDDLTVQLSEGKLKARVRD